MVSYIKEIFRFQPIKTNPIRVLIAGFCVLMILLAGYFSGNMYIASFGSLGIFIFAYYQNIPKSQLVQRLVIVSIYLYLCLLTGMLSHQLQWLSPIIVAIFAFLGRFLFRLHGISKPGPFFAIMIITMGASMQVPIASVVPLSSYFLVGAVVSIVASLLVSLTEKEKPTALEKLTFKERLHQDPGSILDAIFYSGTLFFATYLSQGLHFNNAYWLVVSCAAILMGDNLRAMAHRHVQRILGTIVGLLITAFIFNIHLNSVAMLMMIPLFFMVVEYLIMKNYAVATFFTTPMALMLTTLSRQQYSNALLTDRMIGIVIGSVVGVLAGWIFTVGIEFYNKEFHLHQTLEKEGD